MVRLSTLKDFFKELLRSWRGSVSVAILTFFLIMALFPQLFTKYPPPYYGRYENQPLMPISWEHPLGTDTIGQDIWAMVVYGARISILAGLTAALMTSLIGTFIGIIAGYFRRVDNIVMFISDTLMMIPPLLLLIVIASLYRWCWNMWFAVLAIASISWPSTARIIRARVLQIKALPYIEAARALGASDAYIIFRHILPNIVPLLIARATIMAGGMIVTIASLSFLGFGDPSNIDWGLILRFAYDNFLVIVAYRYWQWFIVPGLFISLTVMAFVLLGEFIQDYLHVAYTRR